MTQSLIGRSQEFKQLQSLLADNRLVTIVGPGGVGKTTLLAAAAASLSSNAQIVRLAPLSPIDLRDAVAGALRFASYSNFLSGLEDDSFIVLDNCEHVLDVVAGVVDELLETSPGVRVAATSREPLGVRGEKVLELAPLSTVGDPSPASALFMARMQERGLDPPEDRSDIDALCERLDGLPLALELAAARTAGITPREMLLHLADRMDLVAKSRERGPARHWSLSATVGWSFQLLEDELQELFLGLSVFDGSFTAQMVSSVTREPIEEVTEGLLMLVDRSLVVHEPTAGESWYRTLSTIRAFGKEKLLGSGRWADLNERLVDVAVDEAAGLSERAVSQADPSAGPATGRIFGVLRSAIEWCLEHDVGPERATVLISPLWSLEDVGHQGEAADLAGRVIDRWDITDAYAIGSFALVSRSAGRFDDAEEAGRKGMEAGGPGAALGYRALGMNARSRGEYEPAINLLQTGADFARGHDLGGLAFELDCHRGLALARAGSIDEALSTWSTVGQGARDYSMAEILSYLFSTLVLTATDLKAARRAAQRALARAVETDYAWAANHARQQLALVDYLEGDRATGILGMADTIGLSIVNGSRSEICLGFQYAAALFSAAGRNDLASSALRESEAVFGRPDVGPSERRVLDAISSTPLSSEGAERKSGVELVAELRQLASSEDGEPTGNRFLRTGELWEVVFGGRRALFAHAKGFADLYVLLRRPGVEVAALDLMGASVVSGDSGPVSDTTARRNYEARIRELQGEITEAEDANDSYRAEKASEELDALVEHLAEAYGLGGRARTAGDVAEKARTAVTWRIRAAIKKISSELPELGDHLTRAVKTGRFCSYDPEIEVSWVFGD